MFIGTPCKLILGGDLSYVPDESCSEIDESLAGFKFHMCAYDVVIFLNKKVLSFLIFFFYNYKLIFFLIIIN